MVSAAGAGNESGLGGWRGAVGPKNEQSTETRLNGTCQTPRCVTVCHILRSRRVEGGFQMRAFKGPSVTSVTETLP